jgi:hypothetical protein
MVDIKKPKPIKLVTDPEFWDSKRDAQDMSLCHWTTNEDAEEEQPSPIGYEEDQCWGFAHSNQEMETVLKEDDDSSKSESSD